MVEWLLYSFLFSFWLDVCSGFNYQDLLRLPLGLSLQNIFLYLLIIVWLFTLKNRDTMLQHTNINRYMFLLTIFVITTITINSIFGYGDYKPTIKEGIQEIKSTITPLLVFIIITSLVNEKRTCERLINALILFLVMTVFTTLLRGYSGNSAETQLFAGMQKNRYSGFGGINQYAAFIVLFLPLFMSHMLFKEEKVKKIIGYLLFFISLAGLIATVSKGGFISFFASMGAFFIFAYKKGMITKFKIVLYLYLFVAIGAASFFMLPHETRELTIKRITLQDTEPEDSYAEEKDFAYKLTTGRTEAWLYCFHFIGEKPILGYSRNLSSTFIGSPHNDYLAWLVDYGVIGFLLFSIIYINIFRHIKDHLILSVNLINIIQYLGYLSGYLGYIFAMFGTCLSQQRLIFFFYTALIYKYIQLDETVKQEPGLSS